MIDEKGGEGLHSSDVGWAHWQGEVNLLLHMFWCLSSLCWLWGILVWSLVRGVFQHHLPVHSPSGVGFFFGVAFPLPIANGLPPVFFRAVCLVRAMQQK